MASKASKACDISAKVRAEVTERDNGTCIVCGTTHGIQIAHYISRARLGLGIPKNLACMCHKCHFDYDNGKRHGEIKTLFEGHLQAIYEQWNETELTYKKYGRI